VRLTVGEYTNIKITTPEDMPMAMSILSARRRAAAGAPAAAGWAWAPGQGRRWSAAAAPAAASVIAANGTARLRRPNNSFFWDVFVWVMTHSREKQKCDCCTKNHSVKETFPYGESNPGLLGENQLSWPLDDMGAWQKLKKSLII
jgi:hypothetical protein